MKTIPPASEGTVRCIWCSGETINSTGCAVLGVVVCEQWPGGQLHTDTQSQVASLDIRMCRPPTKLTCREEPYRGEVPVSFLGPSNIIPVHSHVQVFEQGLQLRQRKAVILPIALHEIFQEGGGAEGWHGSRGGPSLGGSSPYAKQHQQEAAREGAGQGLHGGQVHLEEHKTR